MEEWKDVVRRQMRATRLVVIRAAVGENVLWELTQAAETIDPQKLLILVLKLKPEEYESFVLRRTPYWACHFQTQIVSASSQN
jgi:hypothetical protein